TPQSRRAPGPERTNPVVSSVGPGEKVSHGNESRHVDKDGDVHPAPGAQKGRRLIGNIAGMRRHDRSVSRAPWGAWKLGLQKKRPTWEWAPESQFKAVTRLEMPQYFVSEVRPRIGGPLADGSVKNSRLLTPAAP